VRRIDEQNGTFALFGLIQERLQLVVVKFLLGLTLLVILLRFAGNYTATPAFIPIFFRTPASRRLQTDTCLFIDHLYGLVDRMGYVLIKEFL